MDARKIIDGAIAATAGLVVVVADEALKEIGLPLWRPPVALVVAVVTFVLLHKFEEFLSKNSNYVRELLEPLNKFEGKWIQYVDRRDRMQISVFTLGFDKKSGKHFIDGDAYTSDGRYSSSWYSAHILFDSQKLKIEYKFSGTSRLNILENRGNESISVDGWCEQTIHRDNHNSGFGHFVNFEPERKKFDFDLTRMTEKEIEKLKQKYQLKEDSDIMEVLRAT